MFFLPMLTGKYKKFYGMPQGRVQGTGASGVRMVPKGFQEHGKAHWNIRFTNRTCKRYVMGANVERLIGQELETMREGFERDLPAASEGCSMEAHLYSSMEEYAGGQPRFRIIKHES
jgi:hypothetical protein